MKRNIKNKENKRRNDQTGIRIPLVFASTPADLLTAENFPQFPAVERAARHLKLTGSSDTKGARSREVFSTKIFIIESSRRHDDIRR